jgi:hypothetical protein
MQLFAPAVEFYPPAAPPLRLAEKFGVTDLEVVPAAHKAAADRLLEIAEWNSSHRRPAKNGFVREFAQGHTVPLGPEVLGKALILSAHAGGRIGKSASGSLVWGAQVQVEDAERIRLRLDEVDLPESARIWVYGAGSEVVGPVGLELKAPDGTLWTPSVGGGTIRIEVEIPATAVKSTTGVIVAAVAETFPLDVEGRPQTGRSSSLKSHNTTCLQDVRCHGAGTFDFIDPARFAIARLEGIEGGSTFTCTGGLLNDTDTSTVRPYLQTANHCFGDQAVASTLEAFWDYFAPACMGAWPALGSLPRSNGATLLGTGAVPGPDASLLLLNSIPANRTLLGWNAAASSAPNGTTLHRISHPMGWAQAYSRSSVRQPFQGCFPISEPFFIYQTGNLGGVFGGSSGSPVMIAGGQSVGQLLGTCGSDPSEGCDYSNATIDGSLAAAFDAFRPFLVNLGFQPCIADGDTLCLSNNRFQVELDWLNQQGGAGVGKVVPGASNDSGLFSFTNPNNWEMLVKVRNACVPPFNHYWLFYAATTNVQFQLTVTDTVAGRVNLYVNPLRFAAPPVQDTLAFATCP